MKICSRCVYDEKVPGIYFDAEGVCNYCHIHDSLNKQYPTGEEGAHYLEKIAQKIREDGKGKKYDVIVGVSGGCDSSYLLYLTKKLNLRPLAVHFDNTWDSTVAVENIQSVLSSLKVDLETIVVDNKEYDDIYRSFLKSGAPDTEAPTDIALAATLYIVAEKYKVRYIFEGHSFRTEGVAPLGWSYMDGKYIQSVQKQFGTFPLKTFPNLWMKDFLKWTVILGIKKIRPLYYIDYNKSQAMKILTNELGWEWYGGHHLENPFTNFWHTWYMPKRYNIDLRLLGHAALVRSGQHTREQALESLKQPIAIDLELVEMTRKRLGFTDDEMESILTLPHKTYRDFSTYKKTFERLRPFFWILYKFGRVTKSFYMKFCFQDPY